MLSKNYCTQIVLYFFNLILSQVKIIVCFQITFYYSNLVLAFLLVCMFVFFLTSTAKVISEHCPINVVSQHGIEPGSLQFQNNHEMHYATEATATSNISVATNFFNTNLILYIKQILIMITIACRSHQSPVTSSQIFSQSICQTEKDI